MNYSHTIYLSATGKPKQTTGWAADHVTAGVNWKVKHIDCKQNTVNGIALARVWTEASTP